jgi:hypothetical protein
MTEGRSESPIFVKTHDFACWLLARTIQFPKSQRFVMAKRVEESVLDFEERLIRAARVKGRARMEHLREADVLFEILRRHLRTCVELKLLTVRQCVCERAPGSRSPTRAEEGEGRGGE